MSFGSDTEVVFVLFYSNLGQRVNGGAQIDCLTLTSGLSSLSSFSPPRPAIPVTLLHLLLLKTRTNEDDCV